ncbi:accessory gene regulator ArgB-like protein [Clostridium saccharobutylicum]|uniref:Putative AgrB-like protein 1 n=1 Tax=Clostridium saccharobutylicum DSM 13864 TaxID=1345695 RepID=U5MMW2_CLOSA|nr:accessory gene regulator B family protein [Clostridium saccharobutylicum]AGX41890.1 putative AgrB-like protein 1 [Clostridium saccharobutylicum DSM 13864]AQR89165.1 accessory gene regulator protein B [Clostridium saccharobutylicum]AQR99066.1 accessory protein regulator protein B [Clostridium saccharobutylicum]AQS08788.1 accessory gene regulator protein B [Clostridium saccharobutylicum]AQS13054.1 accessory gene regulator protein B [Clostridium saccharobutylicum]
MIKELSNKIVNSVANDECSKDDIEQMDYALRTILYEFIKAFSLIIIFSLFGYLKQSLIITVMMCLIKPFIGGYHEETQIKCFIATLLLAAGILILSLQCSLSFVSNVILIVLSIFCIWNQAPIINSKMPLTNLELIKKNRIRGVRNSIIIGIISIVLYNYSNYYLLITWTILFEALLMFDKRKY